MPKGFLGVTPFEEYTVYGPVLHKKEGRKLVFLVKKDRSSRTTMAYARYLMAVHLGKRLGPKEHVDHIDGDKLNDVIENLQILTAGENNCKLVAERGISEKKLTLACPSCGELFQKRKGDTHLVKGGRFTSCSRCCSGKFKRLMQLQGDTPDILERLQKNICLSPE